jgi:hypothetical protein
MSEVWKAGLSNKNPTAVNAYPLLSRHKKFAGWEMLYLLGLCLKVKIIPPDWLTKRYLDRIVAVSHNNEVSKWDDERAFGTFRRSHPSSQSSHQSVCSIGERLVSAFSD